LYETPARRAKGKVEATPIALRTPVDSSDAAGKSIDKAGIRVSFRP
jgi:hypothetical protein